MNERIGTIITPEQFSAVKQSIIEAIGWASTHSAHSPPREFTEALSGYLATAHFAFIEREARMHHSLERMTGALTHRQSEIMHCILTGMTNKFIAQTIMVSEATVHHDVTKIFKAFSVINRGELIDYFSKLNKKADEQVG